VHDFKHISRYVTGAVELDPGAPLDAHARAEYARNLSRRVLGYLNGALNLDASFNAFERELALDAAGLFGGEVQARRMWQAGEPLPCYR